MPEPLSKPYVSVCLWVELRLLHSLLRFKKATGFWFSLLLLTVVNEVCLVFKGCRFEHQLCCATVASFLFFCDQSLLSSQTWSIDATISHSPMQMWLLSACRRK